MLAVKTPQAGAPLIYGGRLAADDLLGDPDLLRLEGTGYVPGRLHGTLVSMVFAVDREYLETKSNG
jgi:hypothetical protein